MRSLLLALLGLTAALPAQDIVIYGGTSGGITAAIQAAREGRTAVLIEPTQFLGGLTTGGLGATDIGNKKAIGGLSREFYTGIGTHYADAAKWVHQTRADYFSRRPHGNEPDKIAELRRIEEAQLKVFGELLAALGETRETGGSLLDRTQVLYGSCLGNANSHSNQNLPIILAGGGFRHGGHLAFDRTNNTPLANLFGSMLQDLGVETDRFATGTGTLRGLRS